MQGSSADPISFVEAQGMPHHLAFLIRRRGTGTTGRLGDCDGDGAGRKKGPRG
jgi:hypothetical protein